jgi:hypothetical protein
VAAARGTVRFPPGTTTRKVPLSLLNDTLNEADETLTVRLRQPVGAVLIAPTAHTLTIVDDDRKSLVDVRRDFGAKGDGLTDDTAAMQKAIDTVHARGGGVILFPRGVFMVTSVMLRDGITYQGEAAVIKRPARQSRSARTFTTHYAGDADSQPLVIKGLTFDGNGQEQGPYRNYELEQAHLLFLYSDPSAPGRLVAFVEDCVFRNAVADGISVYTDVVATVYRCRAQDVFRGGFVLTGGNSRVTVRELVTSGKRDPTGIDIEVDGRGFGNTLKVDVRLDELRLLDGDFDVAVSEGSTVTGNAIQSLNGPFYLYALGSRIHFTDSRFTVGVADGYMNRILFPHDVTFERCEFRLTRQETGKPYAYLSAADIWWQHPIAPTQRDQIIVFDTCRFTLDPSIRDADQTYAIHALADVAGSNNRLVVKGETIDRGFDVPVLVEPTR